MKKLILIIISIIFISISLVVVFFTLKLKNEFKENQDLPAMIAVDDEGINFISNEKKAVALAKQVWKQSGYASKIFMLYHTRLVNDKYWVIEGVSLWDYIFTICGGGPYIILEKNGKVLFLGETG